MRIVISGHNGFIGGHLLRNLNLHYPNHKLTLLNKEDFLSEKFNNKIQNEDFIFQFAGVNRAETDEEVFDTIEEIYRLGVKIFNIGQYLQPTKKHLKVQRYVSPEQFDIYKQFALNLGFLVVESGPLVRSSYMADKQAKLMNDKSVA